MIIDAETLKPMTVAQERRWRERCRTKFWYVRRTDTFQNEYWNAETRKFVGSFVGLASKHKTKAAAEKVAFRVVILHPDLIGKIEVCER